MRTLCITSLLLTITGAFGQQASFLDDPPSDYFSRTSMDDCVQRFYSEPEKLYLKDRVYRGSRVFPGEFRHIVAIGWIPPNGNLYYLCAGSLITKDFVLSAAQCTEFNATPIMVRVGDTVLGSEEDDEYAQQVGIGRIIVHPQYRESRKYFDLALIQLAEPIKYSRAVCPACLWREPSLPPDRMDAIGLTSCENYETPRLMRKEINTIEQSSCNDQLSKFLWKGLGDDEFCVKRTFLCNSDTGGPIGVKRLTVGGFVLPLIVGIESITITKNSTDESFEVYTKISSYIDWIEREINQTLSYGECSKDLSCLRPQTSTTVNFAKDNPLQRFGLIWDDTVPSLYDCGATLIDYQYLLTSASCVTTNRGDPSYVSHDGKERIAVEDVYVSPKYVQGRPENDVALVKIAKFTNPRVHRPSCLWNRRTDGEWSTHPVVSAYGPSEPLLPSDSSQHVNRTISIRPKHTKDCKADGLRGSDLIRCLNRVQKVPPLCSMDYGAPVTNDRGKPEDPNYIYGVVSSLNEGCESKLIITDVTPHIVWIEDTIISGRYIFSDTRHRSLVPITLRFN